MVDEELTLAEYQRALLNQRKIYRQQGNGLLNPNVSNDVSTLAGLDTSFQRGVDSTNVPTEQDLKTDNSDKGILDQIFGFVDEIAAKFGAGFVSAWEGGLDLIATGIGALGDATGWYSSQPFADWAKQDIGTSLAEWTKTYANFNPWAIVKNIQNGNYGNQAYWEGMWEGAKDIGGSALFMSNELNNYRQDSNKYYGFNDDVLNEMGQVGEFLGGAAHSIGFMLPSIMTGGSTMAGTGSQLAAKGMSLGVMGLGAAGKGSEEALNEGASAGQALGYGVASGAIEVASEIVVGKALGKLAEATGLSKYLGSFGKINGVTYSKELVKKAAAKELVSTMIEEGAEEVFSDLFAPFCEAFYKGNGSNFLERVKNNYGSSLTDEQFYKQMAMSFASGAFVGGLTSGVQTASNYKAYGKTGVAFIQNNAEYQEAMKDYKANPTEANAEKVKSLIQSMQEQLSEMANNPAEKQHLENLVKAFTSAEINGEKRSLAERQIDFETEMSKDMYQRLVDDVNRVFEPSSGTQFVLADSDAFKADENGVVPKAVYNSESNQVAINKQYQDQMFDLIKHEGLTHAILDYAPGVKAELIKAIESNKELSEKYHANDKAIEEAYKDKSKEVIESEKLASFSEGILEDFNQVEKILRRNFNAKSRFLRFFNKIENTFKGIKGINKTFLKSVQTALRSLQAQTEGEKIANRIAYQMASKPVKTEFKDDKERLENVGKQTFKYELSDKVDSEFSEKVKRLVHAGATFYTNTGSEIQQIKIRKSKLKGFAYAIEINDQKGKHITTVNKENLQETRNYFDSAISIGKTAADVKLNKVKAQGPDVKLRQQKDGSFLVEYNEKGEKKFKKYESRSEAEQAVKRISNRLTKEYNPYGRTSKFEGGYTAGANNIPFKVVQMADGTFEIQYNDQIIKEESAADVKKYLEKVNAKKNNGKDWRKFAVKETKTTEATKVEKEAKAKVKSSKAKASTKVTAETTTSEYKTMQTTRDIIKNVASRIEADNKNIRVSFPRGFANFSSKAFSQINNVKTAQVQARHVINLLKEASLRAYANGEYITLGKLSETLDTNELQKYVEEVINNSKNEVAETKATKKFEVALNKVATELLEQRSISSNSRVITNQRRIIKNKIKSILEITTDYVSRNGVDYLLSPVAELQATPKGSKSTFKAKDVRNNFESVLSMYEEMGRHPNLYSNIPYQPEVSIILQEIIDSIGEADIQVLHYQDGNTGERFVYGGLSAETLELINTYTKMVSKITNDVKRNIRETVLPSVIQSYNVIEQSKYGKRKDILSKGFRSYLRGFAPTYTVLRRIFGGNSAIADKLTTNVQIAQNSKQLYVGDYHNAINEKLKELGIKKTFDSKKVTVDGKTLTVDQALYLYISLNVPANYEAIDQNGLKYYDENGNTKELVEKGNAEALRVEVNKAIEEKYKQLGDWLLEKMNSDIKEDYAKWYKTRFGEYNGRNEIGAIGENSYWTLRRAYEKSINIERAVTNPEAVFSNAKSRVNSDNAVMLGGALSTFTTYIDKLSTEIYLKPIYREAYEILNTKAESKKTVYELLKERVDPQDFQYIENATADIVGALNNKNDIFSGIMSRFSVAKLSLNVGSILKQFASIYTSNLPIYKSTKGFLAKAFKSQEFKSEFNTLVKGEIDPETGKYKKGKEPIGGLKYRDFNKAVVKGNADGLGAAAEWLAEKGMKGISLMDSFTIGTGVRTLMFIGQDQYGYKIGSQENIDFVKEQWTEFELSQIGSGALSKNAMSRGDYGSLAKALFSFLQGANRAALGSQINKIDLCSCSQEPTIVDVIDTAIVIKAAYEHQLEYFYIKTEIIKYEEPNYIYHTDYIGVDEYHTYYSLEYLSAVKDNELLQIVEVKGEK